MKYPAPTAALSPPVRREFHPAMGLGLLMVVCVALVGWVRWSGQAVHVPDEAPTVLRALHFEDMADGAIGVIDAATGERIDTIQGEQGFMRGALRSLARERKRRGIGQEQAFELIARKDGRLTLHDPATLARIDLESFGPTNASVFVRLLRTPPLANGT